MKFSKAMLLGLSMLATPVFATNYAIDVEGAHASVNFKVGHLGYSFIKGRFNTFDGDFTHDKDNPAASRVSVVIDTTSLDTNHAERDKHLRSSDFLDVSKHPEIRFESTSFKQTGDTAEMTGKLTMMGTTRDVTLDVTHIGEGKDPWGGYRTGFEGTTQIAAADFGLPAWVGDVEIEVHVEGIRQ